MGPRSAALLSGSPYVDVCRFGGVVPDRLFGRNRVREMVQGWLLRPTSSTEQGVRPVLLLEGGPGSGRTAALDALGGELRGQVPYAHVDLKVVQNDHGPAAIPELLAAAARQLHEYCEPYGRLDFSRLTIALKVMEMDLRLVRNDPQAARRAVDRALKAMRGAEQVSTALQEVSRGLGGTLSLPVTPPSGVLDYGVYRLFPLPRRQEWFGHQDTGSRGKPIDTLLRLNEWAGQAAQRDTVAQGRINDLVWRAFLADLNDDFAHGRDHDRWPASAVLLLDNADTALGAGFLLGLVQQAGLRAGDPLTIVAAADPILVSTVRRSLIADFGCAPAAEASPPRWIRRHLRDLTADEVLELVAGVATELPGDEKRVLADELFQFTAGHPAATRILLDAALTTTGTRIELEAALLAPRGTGTVEDHLRAMLLRGVGTDVVPGLEICAAGWNRSDADFLASTKDLVGLDRVRLPAGVWPPRGGSEPTLVRRLLLRRLAARAEWPQVYTLLRQRSDGFHETDAALYYQLANDDLDAVARTLTDALQTATATSWLPRLTMVSRAPRRIPNTVAPELAAQQRLTGLATGTKPFDIVLAVLVRLWIASDPLCGSARAALYRQLKGGLEALKEHLSDGDSALQAAVDHYEELARRWTRTPHLRPTREERP